MPSFTIPFEHSYALLPQHFYALQNPSTCKDPKLIKWNDSLAKDLGLDIHSDQKEDLAAYFSGQKILPMAKSMALVYAGHQFGNFVPRLGDGRAVLLGEIITPLGLRLDVQLKGSGPTPYSRGGDGRSALGPVLREYIVSEAMHYLGVPTTRSLAAVSTGENVLRAKSLPGAVLTRIAASHIRIGTFEYFANLGDTSALKILLEYAAKRHYSAIKIDENLAEQFLVALTQRHAHLTSKWMSFGFIHGVMNTDNSAISGETIDYGPCAFMDEFNFDKVFSKIDRHGRYAYLNQPIIAQWNLARLAECLIPLCPKEKSVTIDLFKQHLASFKSTCDALFYQNMAQKIGFPVAYQEEVELVGAWLKLLERNALDFTQSFLCLAAELVNEPNQPKSQPDCFAEVPEFKDFLTRWKSLLGQKSIPFEEAVQLMSQTNPVYIPRNHLIEKAILAAEVGDFSLFHTMCTVLENPYLDQVGSESFKTPPSKEERVKATFCGT